MLLCACAITSKSLITRCEHDVSMSESSCYKLKETISLKAEDHQVHQSPSVPVHEQKKVYV